MPRAAASGGLSPASFADVDSWVRSLARALVTADTTTGSSRVRNAALPLARYGLRGIVADRFLRYHRRAGLSHASPSSARSPCAPACSAGVPIRSLDGEQASRAILQPSINPVDGS